MKKILMSVAVIGFVGAIAAGATGAFFNDTEVSANNVIGAGALDLKVNGLNGPVTAVVNLTDLKPSFTWWTRPIKLTVTDNPGRLYKKITGIQCDTVTLNEPECKAQHGTWTNNACVLPTGVVDENNLARVTWFDLEKWVPSESMPTPPSTIATNPVENDPVCNGSVLTGCWKVGIKDGAKMADGTDITVGSLENHPMYLGMYGVAGTPWDVIIRQSFHVMTTMGNAYQTDKCTFNEEFSVEQTNAPTPNGALAVRESPTRQGHGFFDIFTEMMPKPDGTIDSFFDVFTELSLD